MLDPVQPKGGAKRVIGRGVVLSRKIPGNVPGTTRLLSPLSSGPDWKDTQHRISPLMYRAAR